MAQADRLLPDLVMMDVNMRELGGVEATSRILQRWPHIGVVGMTADPSSVMDLLSAGAKGCVFKGIPPGHSRRD